MARLTREQMDSQFELEVLRSSIRRILQHEGIIFVFGSNQLGRHGAGAAYEAAVHFRAEEGIGEGLTGQAYAIPTKDCNWQVRSLAEIHHSVKTFLDYADARPEYTFFVTRIGCGYAGYTDADIAPMFANAPLNCILPDGWDSNIDTTAPINTQENQTW